MKVFSISTVSGKEKEIDIETVIKKYIEYSNVPEKKIDENGNEMDLSTAEKGHYRKGLEETENYLKQICKILENETAESVNEYLELFVRSYEEDKENRKYIKAALTASFSVEMIKKWRCENLNDVYENLSKVEKTIPVADNGYLSFDPFFAIYGWKRGNEKSGIKWYPPLKNEVVFNTVKVFMNREDKERLIKWIFEILAYDKKNFELNEYAKRFDQERIDLQNNLTLMIKEDEKLRNILIKELLDGKLLLDLAVQSKMPLKVKNLESDIKKQEERFKLEKEEREKSYRESADRQTQMINEKEDRIKALVKKTENLEKLEDQYDRAREELDDTKIRLDSQRKINEDIKRCDLETISKKDEKINELEQELKLTNATLADVRDALEAIRVDITIKNNEISHLKDSVNTKDSDAVEDLLQRLAANINNQIFYLSMFYQILSENNGQLDEVNVEMFKDVLEQVETALEEIGLKKIGLLNEVTEYDSAIHNSVSGALSNGEKVKVTGFGWEIKGEVFIRIPVEREVE